MSGNVILEKFNIEKSYQGIKQFDCEHKIINGFVHKSLKKQVKNAFSAAYILLDLDDKERVIGFYTVSPFSIEKSKFDQPLQAAPRSIPVLRLIMLGVDKKYAGKGYGSQLLKHCLQLTLRVSDEIGAKGLYLDAEDGKHDWYKKCGLIGISDPENNILPMFISAETIKAAF